eukprot:scaffold51_cov401-Prasinococcus_capsulatus_cf.AAC.13
MSHGDRYLKVNHVSEQRNSALVSFLQVLAVACMSGLRCQLQEAARTCAHLCRCDQGVFSLSRNQLAGLSLP